MTPGDRRGLVQSLERLLDDADLRGRMATAARDKAVREFDEVQLVRRELDVYRELLSMNGKVSSCS